MGGVNSEAINPLETKPSPFRGGLGGVNSEAINPLEKKPSPFRVGLGGVKNFLNNNYGVITDIKLPTLLSAITLSVASITRSPFKSSSLYPD